MDIVNPNISTLKSQILIVLICLVSIGPLIQIAGLTLTGSSYAVLNQTYRFTCTATDIPPLQSLTFRKDGAGACTLIHLLNSTQCRQHTGVRGNKCSCGLNGVFYMNISSVSLQDEDTWDCQLSTGSEKAPTSNNISLSVYYGPFNNVTLNRTSPVTVIEGVTTGSVRCSAHCNPGCSYTWWKGYLQMYNTTDLPLGSLTKNDGGNYTCSVSNTETGVSVTADSQTLTVNMQWHPAQPTHNCPSWVFLGQSGSCTCQTSDPGNPAGTVQWINPQGQTVSVSSSQSPSASLYLGNITRPDNGRNFTCRANNLLADSSVDGYYSVSIAYPPNKPTITDPGSLCEGKFTSLTCSSSDPGNPPATYYWIKNNISVATGRSYNFTPEKNDHQAEIICDAGNNHTDISGHSRPQSDVRQLNVYYIPRITVSPAADYIWKEGQNLSLNCSADSNHDNAVLSWTFNGTTLTGVSVEKTNLSRSDHGVYTCTGRVSTGSVCPGGFLQGQGNVSVIVNFAPDITFNPVVIREGEALTLTCEANGRPEIYTFGRFTQYWEDTEVERNTGTKNGAGYTWTKHNATYLETGLYECSVHNTVTNRQNVLVQRKRVSVHVRASPKFTTDMVQRFGAEAGSQVTLSQSFYSNLNYTSVNWTFTKPESLLNESSTVTPTKVTLKKKKKVVKVDGFTAALLLEDFQQEDIGSYTVTACNSIGCSSSDVNLTAAGRPLVPLDFKIMNTTQKSISLRWKPNFPGGDYIQVFILHYRLKGSEHWQAIEYENNPGEYVHADVTGLQPGSVYEFKVRARNTRENDNEGDFTNILLGTTVVPSVQQVPPKDSQLVAIGAGVGAAVVMIVAIALFILVIRRRRQHGSDAEKEPALALHESANGAEREQPEMHDNVLYDTTEGAMGGEKPVMEENVLYAGSGDFVGAASSESVHKKSNAKMNKDQQKKDKKKTKKEDKKQASPRKQKRGEVYENTVPGQFLAGAEASAFANAGFVGNENHYEETAGATANAEKQAFGRNEDGLLYVGIDFGKQKPSQKVHGAEDSTEYAGIAFGKVGPPLPPDEEEKDEEKKESNAS